MCSTKSIPVRYVAAAGLLLCVASRAASAQPSLVAGVGAGARIGSRGADVSNGTGNLHGLAFAEAHLPILPIGVRVDAMLLDGGKGAGPVAWSLDGVFRVSIPTLEPYLLAGYGRYGVGRDVSETGWNAGIGMRVTTGPLHLFGEVRRHQRITRDLITLGITM